MSKKSKFIKLLLITFLTTGFLNSCFKEDLTDCPRPFQITIKALDIDKNDITETGEVKNAVLFVFNQQNELIKAFELNEAQVKGRHPINIEIDYPGYESLFFVAWGNVDDSFEHSNISTVRNLLDLYVRLKKVDGFAEPPGDFFRGNVTIPLEYGGTEPGKPHVVEINRMTSGVTITAKYLKEWNENLEGTYSFVLRETLDMYDPNGNLSGSAVNYLPRSSFAQNGDLSAPIFYTFPTDDGSPFQLDILYNGEVIYSVDRDTGGTLFIPVIGRTLNILIDFSAQISIQAVITPWNVVYQYVEQ